MHLTGQLKLYMQFPAVMAILLIGINLGIYRMNQKAGTILFIFVLIYVVMVGMMYFYTKSIVMKDLVEFAAQYGVVQNVLLKSYRFHMRFF